MSKSARKTAGNVPRGRVGAGGVAQPGRRGMAALQCEADSSPVVKALNAIGQRARHAPALQGVFEDGLAGAEFSHVKARLAHDYDVAISYGQFRAFQQSADVYATDADLAAALGVDIDAQVADDVVADLDQGAAEEAVEVVIAAEILDAPVVAAPAPLSNFALIRKQADARAKHAMLKAISEGIQTKSRYSELDGVLDGDETPNRRTLKINMALRGPLAVDVIRILAGPELNGAVVR